MFKRLAIVLLLFVLVAAVSVINAIQENIPPQIDLNCTGVVDNGSSYTADRDNTGFGEEAYTFVVVDGAGNVIHSYSSSVPVGFTGPIGNFAYNSGSPLFNPITLTFTSLAGNGFEEQIVLTVTGECPGLPTVDTVEPTPDTPEPPCLDIPSGSVVGRLTRTAQIFYAPGQLSPGLFLQGGQSFWVIGFDETGNYAKLVLACQYVWVEADAVGPNFEAPWFGAPLPDRVVE